MNATQELYDLYQAQKMTPLGQELYRGLDTLFQREGKRYWSLADAGRKLSVTPSQVRGWLRGFNIPGTESIRTIARVTGLPEDMLMELAGHPTFSVMLTEVEKHRHEWPDGQYIFSALSITQERTWRISRSQWKVAALEQLERWRPSMTEEDFHTIAFRVAMLIDAWTIDQRREQPPPQRRVAMVLAS